MKKLFYFCIVLFSFSVAAIDPMHMLTCSDDANEQGFVVIKNSSWKDNSYAEVVFHGPVIDSLKADCHPVGRGHNCDGTNCFSTDAVINVGDDYTSIGIVFRRGTQLCSLSWENDIMIFYGPNGNKKWVFNKGCD